MRARLSRSLRAQLEAGVPLAQGTSLAQGPWLKAHPPAHGVPLADAAAGAAWAWAGPVHSAAGTHYALAAGRQARRAGGPRLGNWQGRCRVKGAASAVSAAWRRRDQAG